VRRQALELRRKQDGSEARGTILEVVELVRALRQQGKLAEAEQVLGEALPPAFLSNPASVKLLYQRADLMGCQGRWSEAAADAARCIEKEPTEHFYYYVLAPLLVLDRNFPAYEELCGKNLSRFTNTTNPYWAERVAMTCLLRPNPALDLRLVDRLADLAVTRGSGEKAELPYIQVCKAMSCYRLGRYAEAITWAEKSRENSPAYASAQAFAILTMANWQLGRPADSRALLLKGEASAPDIAFERGMVNFSGPWVAWLIARVAIDEAKALTHSKDGTDNP
jgi:tetratricopeptide (TPR) repeat protein